MTKSEKEVLQKRIVQFHLNYAKSKKNPNVNRILKETIPRQTIYSIIRKYNESSHIRDKPKSGGPKTLLHRQISRLKHLVNHRTDVSLGFLATNFGVGRQTICDYQEEMNIKYHKKKKHKTPKFTDKKLEETPSRARPRYRLLLSNDFQVVMDDEKYFVFTNHSVPTNRSYYTSNKAATSSDVKFKQLRKYELKILVWIAILTNRISPLFSAKQKRPINEKMHLKQCIVKRLIQFTNSSPPKEKVLFWTDLITSI